jgi:hypothetical protein
MNMMSTSKWSRRLGIVWTGSPVWRIGQVMALSLFGQHYRKASALRELF